MDSFFVAASSGQILVERFYRTRSAPPEALKDPRPAAAATGRSSSPRLEVRAVAAALSSITQHPHNHPHHAVMMLGRGRYCAALWRGDLLLGAVVSGATAPSVCFVLDTLAAIARGIAFHTTQNGETLTEATVKEHYAVTAALVEEMLQFGMPEFLELDALTVLVPRNSLVGQALTRLTPAATFLSSLGATPVEEPGRGLGGSSGAGVGSGLLGSGSNIWWRSCNQPSSLAASAGPTGEIAVDIVERLHCVVGKNQKVLSCFVSGELEVGPFVCAGAAPRCQLNFRDYSALRDLAVAFHPCVNASNWMEDKRILFTPPESKFLLLRYSIQGKAMNTVGPPFELTANLNVDWTPSLSCSAASVDEDSSPASTAPVGGDVAPGSPGAASRSRQVGPAALGSFELVLRPRASFISRMMAPAASLEMSSVRVTIPLPTFVTAIAGAEASHGTVRLSASAPGSLATPPAGLSFSNRGALLHWSIASATLDTPELRCHGKLQLDAAALRSSAPDPTACRLARTAPKDIRFAAQLRFGIARLLSGLDVDSVDVSLPGGATRGAVRVVQRCITVDGCVEFRL